MSFKTDSNLTDMSQDKRAIIETGEENMQQSLTLHLEIWHKDIINSIQEILATWHMPKEENKPKQQFLPIAESHLD